MQVKIETQSNRRIMEFEGLKAPGRLFNLTAHLRGSNRFLTEY